MAGVRRTAKRILDNDDAKAAIDCVKYRGKHADVGLGSCHDYAPHILFAQKDIEP